MAGEAVEPWDVAVALRDVTLGLSRHCADRTQPSPDELKEWLRYLTRAQRAQRALEGACEELVEHGATAEGVRALSYALAAAQGQVTYVPRNHRW